MEQTTAGAAIHKERKSLALGALAASPVALAIWLIGYRLTPPVPDLGTVAERLALALKCGCVATLFTLVMGLEAISHERLRGPAIDPLAGHETRRMRINLRFAQNTLEQFVVFFVGLLGLALYSSDGRTLMATTIVWTVARLAFWVGYHRAPRYRGAGLVGLLQSLIVLLYVCARFGNDLAGAAGAVAIVGLFGVAEFVVVIGVIGRE